MSTDVSQRSSDAGWGPVAAGGRRRRWRRYLLVGLLVVLLVIVGTGGGALLHASGQITRVPVEGLESGGSGPTHILVVGSDSREGLTPEQQAELTAGDELGSRTDTIFVLTLEGGRAALLAFPRDLYVERCDGSQGRINAATGIGGPACMVRTVSAMSGLPIERYISVDFLGFVDIVNAVGGVEVCIDKRIQDPFSGADFEPGCQVLDGREALAFVRVRKVDNDLERIKRQQTFLRALAGTIASPSTALNPFELYATAGSVGSALTADEGLGILDLAQLAWAARGVARGQLATHTVPAVPQSIGGAAVLIPIEGEAEALFARFRDGSVLDDAAGGLQRSDVQVSVLNGARVEGLAGTTRDSLEDAGYQVVGVGNTDEVPTTTIRYPAGSREAAELLARDLPVEPTLVEDAQVSTLVLILGRDLAGG